MYLRREADFKLSEIVSLDTWISIKESEKEHKNMLA